MDDSKLNLLFQLIALGGQFGKFKFDFDSKYFYDEEVIDCQFKLYMLLLVTDKNDQDKKFIEFEECYKKLSKEKQEYIREDLKKIFEEQDKNNKEKEKRL